MAIHRRWTATIAVLAATTIGLAGCGPSEGAQPAETPAVASVNGPQGKAMDAFLSSLVQSESFRGSVTVALGDQILLAKGYDQAVAEPSSPNTPKTRFRIGSLTKQFTAMAVLKAQELGKLNVSDPICAYLASCPAAWKPVTITQVLTHTSGIPDYAWLRDYDSMATVTQTPEQLIGRVRAEKLDFAPGTSWQFSNTGFAIAGYIVERATGTSYAQFVQREILDPLGMSDSGYDVNNPATPAHAMGYIGWNVTANPIDMSNLYSAGALYSTTTDMLKWNRFLLTGTPQIVAPATLTEFLKPRVSANSGWATWPDKPNSYAYGLMTFDPTTDITYFHHAGFSGFTSFNLFRPRQQLSIIVLSNLTEDLVHPQQLATKLTELAGS